MKKLRILPSHFNKIEIENVHQKFKDITDQTYLDVRHVFYRKMPFLFHPMRQKHQLQGDHRD